MKLSRSLFALSFIAGFACSFYNAFAMDVILFQPGAFAMEQREDAVQEALYLTILRDNNAEENVNIMLPNGETLLHYAARKNNVGLAAFLLKRGADVNALNRAGQMPIYVAALCHSNKMVNFLLAEPNIKVRFTDKQMESDFLQMLVELGRQ